MPLTFLAHQAPVLPIARRWGGHTDGVALAVGSAAPDLAYITHGWYGPSGTPLWFNGHRLQNLLVLAVATVALTWVVRRVLLAVVPLTVPDLGVFHLRDYRALAGVRYPWWRSLLSAVVGILTHLVLDSFTHSDGAAVQALPAVFARTVGSVGGRSIHVYSALQYGGSVVLAVVTLLVLARWGRMRRFRDPSLPEASLSPVATACFWLIVAAASVIAVGYASTRLESRSGRFLVERDSVAIISGWWVLFVGVVLASLTVSGAVRTAGSERASGATGRAR